MKVRECRIKAWERWLPWCVGGSPAPVDAWHRPSNVRVERRMQRSGTRSVSERMPPLKTEVANAALRQAWQRRLPAGFVVENFSVKATRMAALPGWRLNIT